MSYDWLPTVIDGFDQFDHNILSLVIIVDSAKTVGKTVANVTQAG